MSRGDYSEFISQIDDTIGDLTRSISCSRAGEICDGRFCSLEDVETDELDTTPDYRAGTVNDYGELLDRSSAECVSRLSRIVSGILLTKHHSAITWMTVSTLSTVPSTRSTILTTSHQWNERNLTSTGLNLISEIGRAHV